LEQRNDGNAHGAFFLNSNAMEFVSIWNDRNKQLQFRAIGGIIDFYVFLGPNPKAVVQQYHDLIGTPHLVPKWSLGFVRFCFVTNTLASMQMGIQIS
jgi:alpha-glucosidase (family GH31 glycosyl hydrolase)